MTNIFTRVFARPAIAVALAASLALSPVASAPARAGNNDTAAFIAALIAMGVIASAANANVNTHVEWGTGGGRQGGGHGGRYDTNKALPQYCLENYRTRYGNETFFSKSCLQENYRRWMRLPDECEMTIKVRGRHNRYSREAVYDPRCLAEEGYSVARR